MFLVYINDLPTCLEHCEVALYAEDTVIYFSSLCVTEIEHFINEDLSKLSSWLSTNRLTLNITKSKFILIDSPIRLAHVMTSMSLLMSRHSNTPILLNTLE